MAIAQDGAAVGSISAGCVEAKVIEAANEVLMTHEPKILSFGKADELDPWTIGLSCGGSIDILVSIWDQSSPILKAWLDEANLWQEATCWIPRSGDFRIAAENGDRELSATHYLLHFKPPPRLHIIGGGHIAGHLCALARQTGWHVTVIDPRDSFTESGHFAVKPHAIHRAWPQDVLQAKQFGSADYAILLTHDPKIDDPAITILLKSEAAYIGALGSHTTQQKRKQRLCAQGFSLEDIKRIHGPVGVDIGARTPAEIAVSILAEIISVRNGGPKWKSVS